jgi:hypothetical protein
MVSSPTVRKCLNCSTYNDNVGSNCPRCNFPFSGKKKYETAASITSPLNGIFKRIAVMSVLAVVLLYWSLSFTSDPITSEQQVMVDKAIAILDDKGFYGKAFLLRRVTRFRSTDNWINLKAEHPVAFAATNFPFAYVTLYPDFFSKTTDDTERAVVLLHEAYHLMGKGEKIAFGETWKEKETIGYTEGKYHGSKVWNNMVEYTKLYADEVFQVTKK